MTVTCSSPADLPAPAAAGDGGVSGDGGGEGNGELGASSKRVQCAGGEAGGVTSAARTVTGTVGAPRRGATGSGAAPLPDVLTVVTAAEAPPAAAVGDSE